MSQMAKSNSTSARSKRKTTDMLFPALLALTAFAFSWLVFAIIAYATIYSVFTFTYFFVWTPEERRAICPKGFWHAVLTWT